MSPQSGMTVLTHSCRSGSLEMVQWVIEHSYGDPNSRDPVCCFATTAMLVVDDSECLLVCNSGWLDSVDVCLCGWAFAHRSMAG
jgi:hypothetical protein